MECVTPDAPKPQVLGRLPMECITPDAPKPQVLG